MESSIASFTHHSPCHDLDTMNPNKVTVAAMCSELRVQREKCQQLKYKITNSSMSGRQLETKTAQMANTANSVRVLKAMLRKQPITSSTHTSAVIELRSYLSSGSKDTRTVTFLAAA